LLTEDAAVLEGGLLRGNAVGMQLSPKLDVRKSLGEDVGFEGNEQNIQVLRQ
jgi:hypothetical protein